MRSATKLVFLLAFAPVLLSAQELPDSVKTCDILERIDSARGALIGRASSLKVIDEEAEYSEIRFDQNGNRYIKRHDEPDYRYREIPLALLNKNTCEVRVITIIRTIPKDNIVGTKRRGVKGVVVDGPVSERVNKYTQYVWWRVALASGDIAWIAEHLLTKEGKGIFAPGVEVRVRPANANIRSAPGLRPMPDQVIGVSDSRFVVNLEARYFGQAWMAYNTPFSIVPTDWIPIGVVWKKFRRSTYYHYVPFSKALYREYVRLRMVGQKHLDADLREAFRRLRERTVFSRAIPGRLAADVVEKLFFETLRAIPLQEQSDPYEMDQYIEGELEYDPFMRVQVIVGANGNSAFSLARSGAGALGITQIWKPTCDGLRARYPDAELSRNCGYTADNEAHGHIESFTASILHFDIELERLVNAFGADILKDADLFRMVDAGYNGDIARVIRARRRFGKTWDVYHGTRYLTWETVWYLQKYDYIIQHPWILNPEQ